MHLNYFRLLKAIRDLIGTFLTVSETNKIGTKFTRQRKK